MVHRSLAGVWLMLAVSPLHPPAPVPFLVMPLLMTVKNQPALPPTPTGPTALPTPPPNVSTAVTRATLGMVRVVCCRQDLVEVPITRVQPAHLMTLLTMPPTTCGNVSAVPPLHVLFQNQLTPAKVLSLLALKRGTVKNPTALQSTPTGPMEPVIPLRSVSTLVLLDTPGMVQVVNQSVQL